MKIAVYTAIIDDYDKLIIDQNFDGADWFIFSDTPIYNENWHYLKATDIFKDPRMTARYHKALSHFYFQDYDYSIWIDGTIKMKISPIELVKKAGRCDIVSLKHPIRNCAYAEINECLKMKLDYPYRLLRARDKLFKENYPAGNGLVETKVVVRRNNERVIKFNERWFLTMMETTLRDQVSFNYVCWKLGIKLKVLPSIEKLEDWFEKKRHKKKARKYL